MSAESDTRPAAQHTHTAPDGSNASHVPPIHLFAPVRPHHIRLVHLAASNHGDVEILPCRGRFDEDMGGVGGDALGAVGRHGVCDHRAPRAQGIAVDTAHTVVSATTTRENFSSR